MSRSKKWWQEWGFFRGSNGRRQYHPLCLTCTHACKQSFRVIVVECRRYQSKRAKKCSD